MTNVIWKNTLQNYVIFSYFCFYDLNSGKNGAQCNVFHVKYKTKNLHESKKGGNNYYCGADTVVYSF